MEVANMTQKESSLAVIKKVSTAKTRVLALIILLTFTIVGYVVSSIIVEGRLVSKFRALDPLTQKVLSVESWWLETLAGGCIPMFLAFGIRFFLLNLDDSIKDKVFTALPFIPHLRWLASKPVFFMLGTGAALLGSVLFLGLEGDKRYLLALIIPASLFYLSYVAHNSYQKIMTGSEFSEKTQKCHKTLGGVCIVLALVCWGYAALYSPINDIWQLWSELDS